MKTTTTVGSTSTAGPLTGGVYGPGQIVTAPNTAIDYAKMVTQQMHTQSAYIQKNYKAITIAGTVVRKLIEDYLNEQVFKNIVKVKQITTNQQEYGRVDNVLVEFTELLDELAGDK